MRHVAMSILSIVLIITSSASYSQTGHYEWNSLPFGGAGFVSGIITCPQQEGLVYARTDVGGAYRWEQHQRSGD